MIWNHKGGFDLIYTNTKLKSIFLGVLTLSFLSFFCYASDVLFVDVSGEESVCEVPLEIACEFYGLDIERLILRESKNDVPLADMLEQNEFKAIVVSARALLVLDETKLFSIVKRLYEKKVPLLILGVSPDIESSLLREWSSGGLVGCKNFTDVPVSGFYQVFDSKPIAQQLAGLKIPFISRSINFFLCDRQQIGRSIIQVSNNISENFFPIFVQTKVDGQEVFFLTQNQLIQSSAVSGKKKYGESIFYDKSSRQYDEDILQLLPLLMYLRYACGQHCWQSPGNYANLTIDDPWLTEPYGHLSYKRLLKQMQKSNFHTTIAFIPWNYDRSAPEVVNLFHDHPDKFSICVHGNNHDHYEFYKYEKDIKDPWLAKPLHVQEANIKKSIARMEEFRRMTGLSYELVMVFPHGISPAKTLGLLKKNNFIATVNGDNVPQGSDKPKDRLFSLRKVTLAFGNFASINRYGASKRIPVDIAIDLFLGNPILLYDHHQLFVDGIEAFNKVAETINRIEPDTKWLSLGNIVRHLYLQRIRDDGSYDIRAFCKSIELKNPHNRDVTYFIRKEESFSLPIKQVTRDGEPYIAKKKDRDVSISITIPAGESRLIDIEYENDFDLKFIDISKNDPRVNRLRKLSDLRDITLSKNVLGQVIIYIYYETGIYKLGLKRLAIICFLLAVLLATGTWHLARYIRRRRLSKQEIPRQMEETT